MAIKIALYVLMGTFLVLVNIWFFRSVKKSFFDLSPDVIYPFQIVGEENDKKGTIYAEMLKARLNNIIDELNQSRSAFDSARQLSKGSTSPSTQDYKPKLELPNDVFKPVNFNVSVSGVEVGGLLSWLFNWTKNEKTIRISLSQNEKNAIISGNYNSSDKKTFWIKKENSTDEEIIDETAYTLAQYHFAKEFPEINAFNATEFRDLLLLFNSLLENKRLEELGKKVEDSVYRALLTKLDDLIAKTPKWDLLIRTAASISERVEFFEEALTFYKKAEATTTDAGITKYLQEKIADIKARIELAKTGEGYLKLTKLIGIDDAQVQTFSEYKPTIAILGELGNTELSLLKKTNEVKVLSTAGDKYMQEYTSSIVNCIRLLAPSATKFIFSLRGKSTEEGVYTDSELLSSVEAILATTEKIDILLIPFGPMDNFIASSAWKRAVDAAYRKDKLLVILPAGWSQNYKVPASISGNLLIFSSTDLKGDKASFASDSKAENKLVNWVPGENIPLTKGVIDTASSKLYSGDTYASSIAIGVLSRLISEYPEVDKIKIAEALKQTPQPAGTEGLRIINYKAAKNYLAGMK